MSAHKSHLERIQRWMQSVIMHRGGVTEGVDAPETRQYLDVALEDLESVIRRSRALSSADRLEIYVNAYYARLMECLDEEFSVTRYAMGDELFAAVTFGYLQSYPSQSYTLGRLGANFPRYLAESRLHAGETPENAGASWPEFVIELATFERSLYEVYDGPGTERGGTLDPTEVAEIPPTAWNRLRLVVAPCLRLHRFGHPVHEYWAARKDGTEPAPCGPRATWLAVNRRDFVVERRELAGAEFTLLAEIAGGATLAQAIAAAIAPSTPEDGPVEPRLGAWFARWAGDGYFVGVKS
ncbi:MAG: DNA-binding domain-containing protein [Pirellulales bacterium]